jgi:hypothetical protein
MLSRVIEMYSKQPYMISYSDSNTQYVIRKDMNMEVNDIRRSEFEDNKEVIKIRILKNRQHNAQKRKYKRRNHDPQKMYIKLQIE